MKLTRRAWCAAAGATLVAPAHAAEPPHDVSAIEDFDELWATLQARYCYFSEKHADWNRVRTLYRPMAVEIDRNGSLADFTDLVRRVLNELYDAHTHLADPPDGAPRWPLYDLYVERYGEDVVIAAIQDNSAAADAGLRVGEAVLAVDGVAIAAAAAARMPLCLTRPDPAADAYALNTAVAGRRAQPRLLRVRGRDGAGRDVALPLKQWPDQPNVEWRALDGGLGYIRIRTFADEGVVDAFETGLAALRETRALIIDVRDNGGGDTAVARPIMGRFIAERRAYAQMRRRAGAGLSAPWTEYVEPRGPFTYAAPVVVLTSRWSASMAEGFPMGMRDIGRARIVGAPMMGLGAAVFELRLDRTGVQAQYSAEPVYDTNGAPRARLRPDVETAPGADILEAGMNEARRLAGATP